MITILATIGFGMLQYISSSTLFFFLSMLMRALQGIGTSFNMTSIYSIVASEFADARERHYGYIEMSLGIGMFLGPFLSGIFYTYLKYVGTFLLLAGFLIIGLIIDIILLPNRLNNKAEKKK